MTRLPYLPETPSQTAGPFVHIGTMPRIAGFRPFDAELGREIAGPGAAGRRIAVEGRVLDGTGAAVTDLVVEIWQANAAGIHPHPEDPRAGEVEPDFRGFGRVHTDLDDGRFRIETIKPGRVPGRHGTLQAPHLNLWLVARGINIGLSTRMYFTDESAANSEDPVLSMIEQAHRRETLLARPEGDGLYRFDIRLQGGDETVFLDI